MYPPVMRRPDARVFNEYTVDLISEMLKEPGVVAGMHPEGTRNKGDDPYALLSAKPGVGRVALEMKAGVIPVEASGAVWTLQANAPRHRAPQASREAFAAMLGLDAVDVGTAPLLVDTGADQLVIPLASFDAVRRAAPRPDAMLAHATIGTRSLAYVFAREGDRVLARFFFLKHGSLVEDPGTGSACANLGGWLLATGVALPQKLAIDQGEAVGRPCRLGLQVTGDRRILVSGRVVEIARGELAL